VNDGVVQPSAVQCISDKVHQLGHTLARLGDCVGLFRGGDHRGEEGSDDRGGEHGDGTIAVVRVTTGGG